MKKIKNFPLQENSSICNISPILKLKSNKSKETLNIHKLHYNAIAQKK